jgi:asparagine synthase (glutamine-hydrolysing)
MLATIRHRGPDQFGVYLDRHIGLGNARLSIIDLSHGQQPIANEDRSLWIVFNGEIFNYLELRPELEARGHRFATDSDTEVLLHLYEEYGPECLERLNGQFAFAIWNARDRSLVLARDRLGVRPLFYTVCGGRLIFASTIKSLLTQRQVTAEIDPTALDQIFSLWAPLTPGTLFRNIREIPPGHFLVANEQGTDLKSYWQLEFPVDPMPVRSLAPSLRLGPYLEELTERLIDAVRLRLRADVEVGAYLSGGLDSSLIASLVRNCTSNRLRTFSIAFNNPEFDESEHQRQMARFLGTEHHVVQVDHSDIGRVFPDVVWHAEVPVMRTAPAPMFLLSRMVREQRCKVVLTGEGADEFLGGYDIFKETKVRRFWAQQPESMRRPQLLKRLYPDIGGLAQNNDSLLRKFFGEGLGLGNDPEYSHLIRWRNNRRNRRFFSEAVLFGSTFPEKQVLGHQLPPQFDQWHYLSRAQYLEIRIFLSQYLLSSQGDRMAMAHSVEGRFPFLDYRVVEFCQSLPPNLKIRALTEKYLLKKLGQRWLPDTVWSRRKRPYRAPIHRCFFGAAGPAYVDDLLSDQALYQSGLFKPAAVGQLVGKLRAGKPLGETDDMALVGILSTQLLHSQFVSHFNPPPPIAESEIVKFCVVQGAIQHPFKHEVQQEYTVH